MSTVISSEAAPRADGGMAISDARSPPTPALELERAARDVIESEMPSMDRAHEPAMLSARKRDRPLTELPLEMEQDQTTRQLTALVAETIAPFDSPSGAEGAAALIGECKGQELAARKRFRDKEGAPVTPMARATADTAYVTARVAQAQVSPLMPSVAPGSTNVRAIITAHACSATPAAPLPMAWLDDSDEEAEATVAGSAQPAEAGAPAPSTDAFAAAPLATAAELAQLAQTGAAAQRDALAAASRERDSTAEAEAPTAETAGDSTDDTFHEYSPWKLPFGPVHDDHVVEAATLATIEPPDITYSLALPEAACSSGVLSRVQLEAVVYACQRHEQMLPSDERAGFLIGDGTGVGKGREIAALCWENWLRGRKRSVWLTASADLLLDAERDLRDIGATDVPVKLLSKLPQGGAIAGAFTEGCLLVPYSQLTSAARRDQLHAWLGGRGFDGLIAMDEAHKAKAGKSGSIGAAAIELQAEHPNSRVVYVSATAATQFADMSYMTRLGLWGVRCAFKSFNDVAAVLKESPGSLEMLAVSLKSEGAYIARSLGFRGVDVTSTQLVLSSDATRAYDSLAAFWRGVLGAVDAHNASVGAGGGGVKVQRGALTRALGRTFEQLLLSLKAPTIKALTRRALRAGHSVVICLFSTGDESTRRAIGGEVAVDALVSTAREICEGVLTMLRDRGLGTRIDSLADELAAIPLPAGCLDELVNYFGPEHVAEMSGRTKRLLKAGGGNGGFVLRGRAVEGAGARRGKAADAESINLAERHAFQSGAKRIAIITDAGATGASLHADKRAPNQQRRVHICAELGWSASRVVQSFGRTHRTNQATPPEYVLLTSSCAVEMRVAGAISRRLQSLGALTKGDRRAAAGETGLWGVSDGGAALHSLTPREISTFVSDVLKLAPAGAQPSRERERELGAWLDALRAKHGEMALQPAFGGVSTVDAFLNSALVLPISEQPRLVELLAARAGTDSRSAADGVGLERLNSSALRVVSREQLSVSAAEARGHVELLCVEVDQSIGYAEAEALRQRWLAGGLQAGFLVQRETRQLGLALFKQPTPAGGRTARLVLPHNQAASSAVREAQLVREWLCLDVEHNQQLRKLVEARWDAFLRGARAQKLHLRSLHLLHGSVFKLWTRISACLGERLSVKLVTTADGTSLGGLLVPSTVPLAELKYGLRMSEENFARTSCSMWSDVPAIGPVWWTPKLLVRVKAQAARELLQLSAHSHGVIEADGQGEARGLKQGDRILGLLPDAKDVELTQWHFKVDLGLKKGTLPAAPRLVQSYKGLRDDAGWSKPESGGASWRLIGQGDLGAHAMIAANTAFIPLHATTALRPAGVSSRASELTRFLSERSLDDEFAQFKVPSETPEDVWIEERAAELRAEDSSAHCSWTCTQCFHANSSRSNPRRERSSRRNGATCSGSHFGYKDGPCRYMIGSYEEYAREEWENARHLIQREARKGGHVYLLVARIFGW